MNKLIGRGAEAILYIENNKLIKERIKKNYRINEIDEKLRKYRTRSESKLIQNSGINVPKILSVNDKTMKIEMEYIKGDLIKNILDNLDKKEREKLCKEIGEQIAILHDKNIIHGDLTTSNMIVKENKVYFIDFGLGYNSLRIEDKAVDLHLLKQALESKHYKVFEECFNAILKSYKKSVNYDVVMERLKKVEQRGRYKRKNE
ncbi:MAG: KEOPS complex kinase/ATPase Bud32 [Candidatus Woesearchaeota archaeon]|nr:KEOPS complex kinase/ATPase Bud32 [Candidatus Woesearchaeota archaeon]